MPWARYPRDLGHNFVLSCATCNNRKSDQLAAPAHLERWLQRNVAHAQSLREHFEARLVPHSLDASLQIARWAYAAEQDAQGRLWVLRDETVEADAQWRALLAA